MNQLSSEDHHKAYRKMVQQYLDEKGSVLEDLKHGFIYGSQDFVADLKYRFLGDKKDVELPQQNRLLSTGDPQLLLSNASITLGFDLEAACQAKKIAPREKVKRDMLIYLLWKTGRLSNQEIGTLLGVTYSTVSKAVSAFKGRLRSEKDLRNKFEKLNS